MSLTQSHSEDQIQPPVAQEQPAEAYSPEQARRRREYHVWDPRAAPGTYFLLAVNIAVYLWMVTHSVSWNNPSDYSLLRFGANQPWSVLRDDGWFRLLTATFVHVGLWHIAANMWCLWNLGILGEPLVGPWGMIAVYMLTGIAGNLLSMAWNVYHFARFHETIYLFQIGAGASGAVFGIAGILIVLLSNRALPFPWEELRRLRSSVIKFAAINLVIGLSTMVVNVGIRIDNFAHIGGFLGGLALGVPLAPRMTAGRHRYLARQKFTFAAACLVLSLVGYFIARFA